VIGVLNVVIGCAVMFAAGYWCYAFGGSGYRLFQRIGGRLLYPDEGPLKARFVRFSRFLGVFWMVGAVVLAIYLSVSEALW